MSSIGYVGRVRMQAVENNKNEPAFLKEYPFVVPKVVLEGYEDPNLYAGGTNSVVLVRGRNVTIYTDGSFAEFLEKGEDGNVDWVDSRKGHDDDYDYWSEENFIDFRKTEERMLTEYDLKTLEKKTYKMVLDETSKMDEEEICRMEDYLGGEIIDNYFVVNNGVLKYCFRFDVDLIIPDSVVGIEDDAFPGYWHYKNISIPESLINIPETFFENCSTNCITVAGENPKYYIKNGCLIDRQSEMLVWTSEGAVIPDDGSVSKIGPKAFWYRYDLQSVVIPDSITEIANGAFSHCHCLKEISMPERFENMAEEIFGTALVKNGEKWIRKTPFCF